jgi:ABC-2 type transport system ATP-binding protein
VIVEGRTVAEGAIAELVRTTGHMARFRLRLSDGPPEVRPADCRITLVAREGEWCLVELDPSLAPDDAWREQMFLGWHVTEIRREGGGLEDFYLSATERRVA